MSDGTPPPAAVRKLPVGATIREAYRSAFNDPKLLLKAAAVPILLSLAIDASPLAFSDLNEWYYLGFQFFAEFVPVTLFGVAWHRYMLLGPETVPVSVLPRWRRRHTSFYLYTLTLLLIVYGVGIPLSAAISMFADSTGVATINTDNTDFWLYAATSIYGFVFCCAALRFGFVFPARAVDETYGLRHSWKHTRKQGLRLLLVVLASAGPAFVVFWVVWYVLLWIFGLNAPGTDGLAAAPGSDAARSVTLINWAVWIVIYGFSSVAYYTSIALLVSAVSIAFRTCTGWVPAVSPPSAQSGETS